MKTPSEKEVKEVLLVLEANQKAELRRKEVERQKKLDKERADLILMALRVEITSRFAD